MSNPVRPCIGCGASDDHPRHVVVVADGTAVPWHMDCHALASGCEVCAGQLEGVGGAAGNPKGDLLREHLMTTGPSPDLAGWTAPADEIPLEG
jgi:hypothetical protein